MPTIKQRKAFKEMVENGSNMKNALVKAGYSVNTARAPTKVTESDGWKELLEKHIPDKKLTKVLDEGLSAGKMVGEELEPDYAVRHKYLVTGLELKNKFPKEKPQGDTEGLKGIILVVNNILDGKSQSASTNLQLQ